MKYLVLLIVAVLMFSVTVVFVPTVDAQTCSGTPNCDNFKKENPCNSHCACSWDGATCTTVGCSSCGDQTTCEASACTWTPAPGGGEGDGGVGSGGDTEADRPMTVHIISPQEGQKFRFGKIPVSIRLTNKYPLQSSGEYYSITDYRLEELDSVFGNQTLNFTYNPDTETFDSEILAVNLSSGKYVLNVSAKARDHIDDKNSTFFFLDNKLNVDFDVDDNYILGSEIPINGTVYDVNREPPNVNVSVVGEVDNIIMFQETLQSNGTFEYSYRSSFFDIEGNWTITVIAYDEYGNIGEKKGYTNVKIVQDKNFYTVSFRSPAPYFIYKRGETFKIDVGVEKSGQKVEGADFRFRSPDGRLIQLKERGPGVYSADYKLSYGATEGQLNLYVIGIKEVGAETNVGTAKLPITVEKTDILLDILSPTIEELVEGKDVKIVARARYPDDSVPENLDIYATLPSGEEVELKRELDNFVYIYTIERGDEGVWSLNVRVSDQYGNTGSKLSKLNIGEITTLYKIREFFLDKWYISMPIIAAIIIVSAVGVHIYNSAHYAEKLKKESKKIRELKKDAQTRYYKGGEINKQTYQQLIEKYEDRESEIKKILSSKKK